MRTILALVMLAGLVGAQPGRAEMPFSCAAGTVRKLAFNAPRTTMRFNVSFTTQGWDLPTNGLTLEMAYEPETDATPFFSATIPGPSIYQYPGGMFLYRDPAGTIGGITLIKLSPLKGGLTRIILKRKGAAIAGVQQGGVARLVLTSGSSCVRTCGSSCAIKGARLACAKSSDTQLCGILSGCELLNPSGGQCMLPYPSSQFTAVDVSTPTGRHLAYPQRAMPANNLGVRINPARWNQLDGFSPGAIAMVNFPQGVDVALSNLPSHQNYAASVALSTPTVLLDADTGELIEHFAEVDVSLAVDPVPGPPDNTPVAPPHQVLMIRPGRRLNNDGHYIVALRNLVAVGGAPIMAESAFQALRDGTPSGNHLVEARRAEFETIFAKLDAAGIPRAGLVLAWQFNTASDLAIENWLLTMRNETFQALGANAPVFTVTLVEENPFPGQICRRIRGTYKVPLYTTFDGPGSVLNVNPMTNLPEQTGVTDAPFTAIIPCSLLTPTPHAGRAMFYGHGLLGSGFGEVTSGHLRTLAQTYGFVVAATDWQGMSNNDLFTILTFIGDLTNFPQLSERLHQGVLNQLVLGHLMGAPDGFVSHPAFQYSDGMSMVPVIDPSDVFYYGNSQGGILGGTVMALTQETTRGVLGVPAANFSTLLQRSVDFAPYFLALRTSYPDDVERAITYPLLQQLWDKSEPNGWYHHTLSNPLPGTPVHKVLVHMATSDAEVANIATEIMVRTMGIPQVGPVVTSYYNVPELLAPFDGSAMVESDGGFGPVPVTNVPPANNAAHGQMRGLAAIQSQIDQFLETGGNVQNFCSGPCNPQ